MERTVKSLSADGEPPEPPKIAEYGLVTFSVVEDINIRAYDPVEEELVKHLTEPTKDALYQYAQHKYYWESKGKGIADQYAKTMKMLAELEVFE